MTKKGNTITFSFKLKDKLHTIRIVAKENGPTELYFDGKRKTFYLMEYVNEIETGTLKDHKNRIKIFKKNKKDGK